MTTLDLLPCPFCGGAMQLRDALWPSEGDRDAVIHNVPGGTSCPIEGAFSIDTFDNGVSVAEAWNRRALPPQPVEVTEEMATAAGEVIEKQVGAFADMSPSFYPWLARQALEAALRPSGDGIRAGRAEVIEECAKIADQHVFGSSLKPALRQNQIPAPLSSHRKR